MNKKHEKAKRIVSSVKNNEAALRRCGEDKELLRMVGKIIARKSGEDITVKQWIDNKINLRLIAIAKAIPDEGYSMGSLVVVRCGKFTQNDDRRKEYPRSSKYKANHGRVEFKILPKDLRHVSVVGGIVTYIYPNQKQSVKKCFWYERKGYKSGFQLNSVNGYIYNGYHSQSKKEAKTGGDRMRKASEYQANFAKNFEKAARKQYTLADSLACGNCETGSKIFAHRHNLDISKKYRGTFLLKIAKDHSTCQYINRMISSKIK